MCGAEWLSRPDPSEWASAGHLATHLLSWLISLGSQKPSGFYFWGFSNIKNPVYGRCISQYRLGCVAITTPSLSGLRQGKFISHSHHVCILVRLGLCFALLPLRNPSISLRSLVVKIKQLKSCLYLFNLLFPKLFDHRPLFLMQQLFISYGPHAQKCQSKGVGA